MLREFWGLVRRSLAASIWVSGNLVRRLTTLELSCCEEAEGFVEKDTWKERCSASPQWFQSQSGTPDIREQSNPCQNCRFVIKIDDCFCFKALKFWRLCFFAAIEKWNR